MLDLLEPDTKAQNRARWFDPADIGGEVETRRNVTRFACAMWVAALLLLCFNSAQLVTVVNGLGVGPAQNTAVALAADWDRQMQQAGMDEPVALVRGWISDLRASAWPDAAGPRS